MAYLDRYGVRNVVRTLDALAAKHGSRYAPCKLLREMAEKNERFFA